MNDDTTSFGLDLAKFRVPLLTSSNYYLWSRKLELILRSKGLWQIVSGKETRPTDETQSLKFDQKNDIALSTILLLVHDSYVSPVLHLKEHKKVWDTLKAQYETVNQASKDALLERYQNSKMGNNEQVLQYRAQLSEIEAKLTAVGYAPNDEEKLRALLRGLRPEFAITAEVIRATNKSLVEGLALLINKEATIYNDSSNISKATALQTQTTSPTAPTRLQCHYCKRFGHKKNQCFFNPKSPNYRPRRKLKQHNEHSTNDSDIVQKAFISHLLISRQHDLSQPENKWYIDSGATAHMCHTQKSFDQNNITKSEQDNIEIGDGMELNVVSKGKTKGSAVCFGKKYPIELNNVLCVPGLKFNLLSVSVIRRKGFTVTFTSGKNDNGLCVVTENSTGDVSLIGVELPNGLYEMTVTTNLESNKIHAMTSTNKNNTDWHSRLKHSSNNTILKSISLTTGISSFTPNTKQICKDCKLSKSTVLPHKQRSSDSLKSTTPGDLVHTDLMMESKLKSLGGSTYYLTLYDDASAVSMVRFLKKKSETFVQLRDMILQFENACGQRIKRIRMDNGGEYMSKQLQNWLAGKGIKFEPNVPYNPESNGKAERLNRTLNDAARSILSPLCQNKGYLSLWAEAVHTANYLRNRLYTSANMSDTTPYETIYNKKPSLQHVRIFGCAAYVHIQKHNQKGKFHPRARKGIFIGYSNGDAYKVYYHESKEFEISNDVRFDETDFNWKTNKNQEESSTQFNLDTLFSTQREPKVDIIEDASNNNSQQINHNTATEHDLSVNNNPQHMSNNNNSDMPNVEDLTYYPPEKRTSQRKRNAPDRFSPEAGIALLTRYALGISDSNLPDNYKEAIQHPEKDKWVEAMRKELEDLKRRNVLEITTAPKGIKTIPCRWVYDRKRNSIGDILRHRARLVAKGFMQRYGIHFIEVFCPVVKYTTVRLVFAIATNNNWIIIRIDVRRAFLYGLLDEEIYINQPEGFIIPGSE